MSDDDLDRFSQRAQQIAALNDALRTTFNHTAGRVVMSQGIAQLPDEDRAAIFDLVQTFNDFSEDNDPYGEHDFGKVMHGRKEVFWKIDYYDPTLSSGSEDPADPIKTARVLTIMMTHEY